MLAMASQDNKQHLLLYQTIRTFRIYNKSREVFILSQSLVYHNKELLFLALSLFCPPVIKPLDLLLFPDNRLLMPSNTE
jgi:hypothetical protein